MKPTKITEFGWIHRREEQIVPSSLSVTTLLETTGVLKTTKILRMLGSFICFPTKMFGIFG